MYALKKAFNELLNKLYKLRVFTDFELNLFYDLGVSYNTLVMVFLKLVKKWKDITIIRILMLFLKNVIENGIDVVDPQP